jgi:FtsH-binding integral membrane protein
MSSKAALCQGCGYAAGEASPEDLLEFQRRKLRDHIYRLKMWSYLAISLFLAAFGWYWWDTRGFSSATSTGPVLGIGVAVAAYLAIRVMLFMEQRKMKSLRRTD